MQLIKSLTYKILCNPISGSLLRTVYGRLPDVRWPRFSFLVPRSSVNNTIAASVFWGFYESSEIRFIEKYFKGDRDVVEIGASLGIVSSHIASKLQNRKLISVEANPFLVKTIEANVGKHISATGQFEVINKALSYDADHVNLRITDNNTETRIDSSAASTGHTVETCRLSKIVDDNNFSSFLLVCDIEGAEAGLLLNETAAFQQCSNVLIELHETNYKGKFYSVNDLLGLLMTNHGFAVEDSHGPVFYLSKSKTAG